ncbi:MAG TPA: hypothetical protein VI603_04130 [Saprospiraceae bacterium]|nr:hypothetical protein [Saprospiraceae bacterium]
MHDLLAFPDTSRVWIYQADKFLPADEIGTMNSRIVEFSREWTSHNQKLRATGGLLHDLFLVLVADESMAGASGCSIDTSVKFVRQVGKEYDVDFFNRLHFAYLHGEQVKQLHRDQISDAYRNKLITDDTLFFDNLVKDKGEFLARWITPFGQSWMKRFI